MTATVDGPAAVTVRSARQVRVLAGDGVRLACSDYGNRSACHTVVFLHGWCLSQLSWSWHADYLARRHQSAVRVINYDHRGHGRSQSAPAATYRVDRLADDLACILDALDVTGKLTLVGHSLGAMVALEYLRRNTRPVNPYGLVLVAAAAGRLVERGWGRLLAAAGVDGMCRVAEHSPDRLIRGLVGPVCAALGRRWMRRGPAQHVGLAEVAASALATTPAATAAGFLTGLREFDATAVLGSITARTVVVSGSADALTPVEHSVELADAIPGAVHVCVPGGGHMLAQQVPHMVARAIDHVVCPEPGLAGDGDRGRS